MASTALLRLGNNKYLNASGPEWLPAAIAIPLCFAVGWLMRQLYNKWFSSTWRAKVGDGVLFWGMVGVAFAMQKLTGLSSVPHAIYGAVGTLFNPSDAIRFGANMHNLPADAEKVANGPANDGQIVIDDSALHAIAALVAGPINQKFMDDRITLPDGRVIEIDSAELVPFIKRGMQNGAVMAVQN